MKKSPIERLMETHPQMEIWWDSSPLIYASWAEGFVKKAPPDRAKDLKEALLRLFDPEHPEKTLFRGVTTNPPLSLAVLKTHGSAWERVVDGLIEKNPCVDKESLFWLTYKEIVRQGAEMYRGLFEQSRYRYGYLSGQVDPRALYNKEKMISQALELAGLGPNVMVKVPGTKEGYEVIRFLTSKGISTNNTLTFVLPQLMACANAVKEGLEIARQNGVDLTRWRSVITHMTARYGDLGDLREEGRIPGPAAFGGGCPVGRVGRLQEGVPASQGAGVPEQDAHLFDADQPRHGWEKVLLAPGETGGREHRDYVSSHVY